MEKVIFDSNAYRYLSTNKSLQEIKELVIKINIKEKEKNIESYISPIVSQELLAHLSNKSDPVYIKCRNSIIAQFLHSGNDNNYSMIPFPEMHIAKSFFNQEISKKKETCEAIGQIIYSIYKDPENISSVFQSKIIQISNFVQNAEDAFAKGMQDYLHLLDTECTHWKAFENNQSGRTKALNQVRSIDTSNEIALSFLYITYVLLNSENKVPTKDKNILLRELTEMCPSFISSFPEVINLNKLVRENMINSEFNLYEKSRANFVWDIQLMFFVGQNSINNSKITFVTSDKAMKTTGIKTNSQNEVYTFYEYLDYIGVENN